MTRLRLIFSEIQLVAREGKRSLNVQANLRQPHVPTHTAALRERAVTTLVLLDTCGSLSASWHPFCLLTGSQLWCPGSASSTSF